MIEWVEAVSEPGRDVNEDCWGEVRFGSGAAAWVIDGATGVAGRDYIAAGPTDAAWLARTLSRFLSQEPVTPDIEGYFGSVMACAADAYAAEVPDYRSLPPYALPSAAAIWVRFREGSLDLAWMGDCVAAVMIGEALHLVGATEAFEQNQDVNSLVAARLAEGNLTQPMTQVLGHELRARRAGLNQPGGYWMFGIEPRAVAGLQRMTLAIGEPATLLLCSDGFWRLVDHFAAFTPAGLIAAAQAQGLAGLLALLRRLEAADPEGRRVPRVKPRDDATAVLYRLWPSGLKS